MPYCFNRVMQYHPWTGESHHLTNLVPHVLPVAMSRAFLARGLLLSILACGESFVSVFFKLSAIAAEGFIAFFLAAV